MKIGEIEKEILKLDKIKSSPKTDIPTRIIKKNIDIFLGFLCTSINGAIKSAHFPSFLKLAEVTPLHKKGRKDIKKNFRSNILPNLIKKFEKCMFAQMYTF